MDRTDEAGNRSVKDMEMEARAVAIARQYGFFLPGPAKAFFRELAGYLNWENLGESNLMQIIIDKARLQWALEQLNNLENGGNIRYEGNTTFQGLRAELVDIEKTAAEYVPAAPQVLAVMTADQVEAYSAKYAAKVDQVGAAVVGQVRDEIERSDAVLTSAIVQTGQDTVAALKAPAGA